jgi:acyl-CoA thioester hydrolase
MRHHSKQIVRWDDLDAYGHLNNAAYLTLIQEARADMSWYARQPLGLDAMFPDMVVARAEVDYLLPVYEGSFEVDVAIWVTRIGNSSFDLAYEITSSQGLHARAKTVQVAVNVETKKARRVSDDEKVWLNEYLEETEENE